MILLSPQRKTVEGVAAERKSQRGAYQNNARSGNASPRSSGIRPVPCILCQGGPEAPTASINVGIQSTTCAVVAVKVPALITPGQRTNHGTGMTAYKPFWIEEPICPDHLDGYERIKSETGLPIAGGEHWYTR